VTKYEVVCELKAPKGVLSEGVTFTIDCFEIKCVKNPSISGLSQNGCTIEVRAVLDYEANSAENIARVIQQQLIPALILASGIPFQWGSCFVQSLESGSSVVMLNSPLRNPPKYAPLTPNIANEVKNVLSQISRLDEDSRKIFIRALKYWVRGMTERDHIDRFVNLYIAYEFLGKNLLHFIDIANDEIEKKWVSLLWEEWGINGKYGGKKVHTIRAALFHYKASDKNKDKLTKEEAENLIFRHINEFAQEVLKLFKKYLDIKTKDR